MRINEIVLMNFMPYKGRQEISFRKSSSANVVVIIGDNMRGKTSFLNAIRWCMYGKAYGRHLRQISFANLINSDAAREGNWMCSVQITFEQEGIRYTLNRALRKRDLVDRPKNNDDFEMLRSMTRDGSPLRDDQVEQELNKLLPEQISRFFLFDGELLQEYEMLLMEQDNHGKRLKEEIEKVLGVPAILNGRDILKVLLKEAQSRLSKESGQREETQVLAAQLSAYQDDQDKKDVALAELKKKDEELNQRINEIEQELANSEALLQRKDQLDRLNYRKKLLEPSLINAKNELHLLLKDAWRDLVAPKARLVLEDAQRQLQVADDTIERRAVLRHEIDHLKALITEGACPTCSSRIEGTNRDRLAGKLGAAEIDFENLKNDDAARSNAVRSRDILSKVLSKCVFNRPLDLERSIAKHQVELVQIDGQTEQLESEIAGQDTADLARKRSQREGLVIAKTKNRLSIDEVEASLIVLDKQKSQVSTLLARFMDSRNDRTARYVETYQQLQTIFSDSVEALRQELKEEVSRRATEAFKKLTTEKTYQRLTINDNYGLTIEDRNGRPVHERSAGAEQIVALALIDGLNRTAGSRGPIVMDTPFGRLDPQHRANVLKYLPDMSEQVFLLVHEGEVSKEIDLKAISGKIGVLLNIERVSSSESRIVRDFS